MIRHIGPLLLSIVCLCLLTNCDNNNTDTPTPRSRVSAIKTKACTSENAKAIAYAYYYSSPLINTSELVNLIDRNRSFFVEGGGAIRCARSLGNALINHGLRTFNRDDYDKAYARTLEMGGTMEMARDVGNSIQSGSMDANMMGQELLWLTKVLPPATTGDWTPYQTTGTPTRNQIRQILPVYQIMMQSDPGLAQIVNSVMGQYEQIAIEQIQMIAIMFDK